MMEARGNDVLLNAQSLPDHGLASLFSEQGRRYCSEEYQTFSNFLGVLSGVLGPPGLRLGTRQTLETGSQVFRLPR